MSTKQSIKHLVGNFFPYNWWNSRKLKNGLYCFNYHRIGNHEKTPFDPNVFSCTAKIFEEHIKFYKQNFRLIDIETAHKILNQKEEINEKLLLLTFDDGYIDNFEVAFPILKKYGISASFFLPTDFIGTNKVPWWDEVAWLIKNCSNESIQLKHWKSAIKIDRTDYETTLRKILKNFKTSSETSIEEKLSELHSALTIDKNCTWEKERLFINWDEVRKMREAGMSIGAHSNTHRILSHLSREDQRQEIRASLLKLEQNLNEKISIFSYPVGGSDSYTNETIALLIEEDIKLAFTFVAGINQRGRTHEIFRLSVPNHANLTTLFR